MMPVRKIRQSWLSLAFLACFGVTGVSAQEWSAEQREVLEALERCNDAFMAEDRGDILDCIHDDFTGWAYGEPVPRTKASFEKFMDLEFETTEPIAYDTRPIAVLVFGDVAVVHYFIASAYRDAAGDVVREGSQWTDIMLRVDGQWQWVADHGGVIGAQP